jgi:hypothetical protein
MAVATTSMPLAGDFLFAARMPLRNADLICQRPENSAFFLTNSGRLRVDFGPFLGFPGPPREIERPEISSGIQGFAGSAQKYERDKKFSIAYVTRVTYKSGTLHRCAEIDHPANGSRGGFVVPLSGNRAARSVPSSPATLQSHAPWAGAIMGRNDIACQYADDPAQSSMPAVTSTPFLQMIE